MWSLVLKNEWFLQVFLEFGLFSNTTDDAISILEEFVCCLCGDPEIKKVDKLRVKHWTRINGDGKNIDLISLPPCYGNLRLHIDRACYVPNMFHESRRLMMFLDDPVEHGWNLNIKVKWREKNFPDDLSNYLFRITKWIVTTMIIMILKSILMMMTTNSTLQMGKRN